MSDAHGVARDQLRAFIERIERLEAEKAAIASDIKDVKAEAKAMGFDIGAINTIVKLRKKDAEKRAEEEQILDTYMIALGMLPEPFEQEYAYDRETGEVFDIPASNGEKAVRPESAASSVEESAASTSIRPAPLTGSGGDPSIPSSDDGGAKTVEHASAQPGRTGEALGNVHTQSEQATNTNSELTSASQGEAEVPSVERVSPEDDASKGSAAANTGGSHVTAPVFAATHQAGGVSATPATPGTMRFEIDPPFPMKRSDFAHCFPELSQAEYGRLQFSIAGQGINEPIVRKGDVILDGWARYNIARSLGAEYPIIEYDGEDELLDVIRWQRSSRDWTPAQEAKIAKDLAKELPDRAADIWAAFHIAELPDGEVVAA